MKILLSLCLLLVATIGITWADDDCDAAQPVLMRQAVGSDGAGLNVQTCVEILARKHGVSEMYGFQQWCKARRGGSYLDKNQEQIECYAKFRNVNVPECFQFYTSDMEKMKELSAQRWLMVSDDGGQNSRYKIRVAAAAVLIHLDDQKAILYDPNFPDSVEMVPYEEFKKRFLRSGGNGEGWVFGFGV